MSGPGRPGSGGEHDLQSKYGNVKRANAFYDNQVLDYLTPEMREFILKMKMMFVATSDGTASATTRSARALPASCGCSTRRPSCGPSTRATA